MTANASDDPQKDSPLEGQLASKRKNDEVTRTKRDSPGAGPASPKEKIVSTPPPPNKDDPTKPKEKAE